MACDHADQIAALVSIAGAMWEDVAHCSPTSPVSVLEVHGTADELITYDGGVIFGHAFPGAPTTVADWVTLDGCAPTPDTSAPQLDLEVMLAGPDTTVTKYGGCKPRRTRRALDHPGRSSRAEVHPTSPQAQSTSCSRTRSPEPRSSRAAFRAQRAALPLRSAP